MKTNRVNPLFTKIKSRCSFLLALAVAAILIQVSPTAFAMTQEQAIIADINAVLPHNQSIVNASGTGIQAALKYVITHYPTGNDSSAGFADVNAFATLAAQYALADHTATSPTKVAISANVTAGALIGLNLSTDLAAVKTAAQFKTLIDTVKNQVGTGLTDTYMNTSGTSAIVASSGTNATNIATAISQSLLADGSRATLATYVAGFSGLTLTGTTFPAIDVPAVAKGIASAVTVSSTQTAVEALIAKNASLKATGTCATIAQYVAQLATSASDKAIIAKTVALGTGLSSYAGAIAKAVDLSSVDGNGHTTLTLQESGTIASVVAAAVSTQAGAIAKAVAQNILDVSSSDYAGAGSIAAQVMQASSSTIATGTDIATRVLSLITGSGSSADMGRIGISCSIVNARYVAPATLAVTAISWANAEAVAKITGSAVGGASAASLTSQYIQAMPVSLQTAAHDASLAIDISNIQWANASAVSKAGFAVVTGTSASNLLSNQKTFATNVAVALESAHSSSGTNAALLVQAMCENLVTGGTERGTIAKAVANGGAAASATSPDTHLFPYAGIIAQQVALSGTLTGSGTSTLSVQEQGYIANQVASNSSCKTQSATIAKMVSQNFSVGGDPTYYGDIGYIAAQVTKAQNSQAIDINNSMLTLVPGSSQSEDLGRIAVSCSIVNVSTVTIASATNIAIATTAAISGTEGAALASQLFQSLPTSLQTAGNDATLSIIISKSHWANASDIVRSGFAAVGGTSAANILSRETTFATTAAVALESAHQSSGTNAALLVQAMCENLALGGTDRGVIAAAVVNAGTATAANQLYFYAGIIAQQIALSGTLTQSGTSSLGVVEQGYIAYKVASVSNAKTQSGTVAKMVSQNFSVGSDSTYYGDIGYIALQVSKAQSSQVVDINNKMLTLVPGQSYNEDVGRIQVSGSIVSVSSMSIASATNIAMATAAAISGSNAAALTTQIIQSLPTSSLKTAANESALALDIFNVINSPSNAQYAKDIAAKAAKEITSTTDTASNNGKGALAKNIALALIGNTNISTATLDTQLPLLADAVAATTGSSVVYESAIANSVISTSTANIADANRVYTILTTVEQRSLNNLGAYVQSGTTNYLNKAKGYALVAANYATTIGTQASNAAGYSAGQAVSTIDLTGGVPVAGIDFYQVAKIFGATLASTASKTALYSSGTGATLVSGSGNLPFSVAPTIATSVGGGIIKTGSGQTVQTQFNLTEVFAAVGVALSHKIATSTSSSNGIIQVATALATICPQATPDLLGAILTDISARTGTATAPIKFYLGTISANLVSALQAIPAVAGSVTITTQINKVLDQLFLAHTPAGTSTGAPTFHVSNDPYHTYDAVAGYAGVLTGAETPYYNQ